MSQKHEFFLNLRKYVEKAFDRPDLFWTIDFVVKTVRLIYFQERNPYFTRIFLATDT